MFSLLQLLPWRRSQPTQAQAKAEAEEATQVEAPFSPLANLLLSKIPETIPLDAGFSGVHLEFSNLMKKPAYSILFLLNYRRYWPLPLPGIIPSDLKGRVSNMTSVGPFLGIILSRILTPHPYLKHVRLIHWPDKKWGGDYWLYTSSYALARIVDRAIAEARRRIKAPSGGVQVNLISGSFTYYAFDDASDSEVFIHITPNDPYSIKKLIEYLRRL